MSFSDFALPLLIPCSPVKLRQYQSILQIFKYRKYANKTGPLKVGSKYEDDPKKLANILTVKYKSVFTTPKDIPDVSLKPQKNGNSLSEIIIRDKDIKEAIDNIAITSAPGPE